MHIGGPRFALYPACDSLVTSGGATYLYHAGMDIAYVRRFGRRKSSKFAIYLHFDGEIPRNLSSCLMHIGGLTSQLKVCTEGTHRVVFEKGGGGWVESRPIRGRSTECVGRPTNPDQENRVGGGGWASYPTPGKTRLGEEVSEEKDRESGGMGFKDWWSQGWGTNQPGRNWEQCSSGWGEPSSSSWMTPGGAEEATGEIWRRSDLTRNRERKSIRRR